MSAEQEKALFVPLYACWFDMFACGKKRVEFRVYGPRWNERTCRIGRLITLSRGYGKKNRLRGWITGFCNNDGTAEISIKLEGDK